VLPFSKALSLRDAPVNHAIFAAIHDSSRLSNLAGWFATPPHMRTSANYSIREPVVAIGNWKGLLACFANRVGRRSNVVTDHFVDGLTNRADIEIGGRCNRHGKSLSSFNLRSRRRGLVRLWAIRYGFAKALQLFRKLVVVGEPQPTPPHFQKVLA